MSDYHEKLKLNIKPLLSKDESVCIAINGVWGIGKTYFWNGFAKDLEQIGQRGVAYISLFEKENIKDIKTAILLNISKKNV